MAPKLLLQDPADPGNTEETTIIQLLNTIMQRQDKFMEQHQALHERLNGHIAEEALAVQNLVRALPTKANGDPDVDGHREYHASLIEEAKARAEFWRDLRMELLRKGLWGMLGMLGFLVMYWWNKEVKR